MDSNIKKYKISKYSLYLGIVGCILGPSLLTLILSYFAISYKTNINLFEFIFVNYSIIIFVTLYVGLPGLYIVVEHLFFVDKTITINITEETITFEKKGEKYTKNFNEVKECIIYKETKDLYFLSSSAFSICYLIFTDGVEEKISCLAEWDLHRLLGRIKYTEQRTVFPSILLYDFLRSLN